MNEIPKYLNFDFIISTCHIFHIGFVLNIIKYDYKAVKCCNIDEWILKNDTKYRCAYFYIEQWLVIYWKNINQARL